MTLPRFTPLLLAVLGALLLLTLAPANGARAAVYSLTVTSEYGNPTPERGLSAFNGGLTVFCSVEEFVQMADGVRMYCTGWTGTGTVPATGNTNTVHFAIAANSTIVWQWGTFYELSINATHAVNCVPATGAAYHPAGTAFDLGAPLFFTDLLYDGYYGSGQLSGGAEHFVSIVLDSPTSITWTYRSSTLTPTPRILEDSVTVDNSALVGKYTSVAINPLTGHPAISYLDETNGDLKFAQYNGTSWGIETVDSDLLVGHYSKLIFGSNNLPIILHYGYGWRDLKISRKDIEGNWFDDIVDAAGFVGSFCGVVSLGGTRLAVAYYDETNGNLLYREFADGFWTPTPHLVLDDGGAAGNVGTHASIARNPITGEPAVAYRSETEDCVYYMYRFEGTWYRQKVTDVVGTGFFTSLAFSPDGVPFIAYQDFRNNPRTLDLIVAQQAGNVWIFHTARSATDAGFYNSMVIDASGYPHIAFYDDSYRGVRYTFWNGRYWVDKPVDNDGDHVGRYCSLALGANGLPHFAYWADNTLRYSKATQWGPAEPEEPIEQVIVVDASGGGCFVATASFGSLSARTVSALCGVRDGGLMASASGGALVGLYYSISPEAAGCLMHTPALRQLLRRMMR